MRTSSSEHDASGPEGGYGRPPAKLAGLRARLAGVAGVLLIAGGVAVVGVALGSQQQRAAVEFSG